jgi:hypothetical protein
MEGGMEIAIWILSASLLVLLWLLISAFKIVIQQRRSITSLLGLIYFHDETEELDVHDPYCSALGLCEYEREILECAFKQHYINLGTVATWAERIGNERRGVLTR